MKLGLNCAFALFVLSGSVGGQDVSETTPAFFLSGSPFLEDKRDLSVITGSELWRGSDSGRLRLPWSAYYGITDNLQANASFALTRLRKDRHVDELTLGLSTAVLTDPTICALSFGVDSLVPTRGGQGQDGIRFWPTLLAARQIGKGLFQGELSWDYARPENLAYGFAGMIPWQQWRLTCEFNVEQEGGWRSMLFSPGLVRVLPDGTEIGIAMPIGLNSNAPRLGAILQITKPY